MGQSKVWFGLGTKILILVAAGVMSCYGQLHSVDIRVSGLDCAHCAGAVEPRLKRMRGVASAKFDFERSMASIVMAVENRITLALIRDVLKGLGHTPGDAEIVVVGTAKDGRLSLPHQTDAFVLEKAEGATGHVRMEGTVAAGTNTLQVRTISPQAPQE